MYFDQTWQGGTVSNVGGPVRAKPITGYMPNSDWRSQPHFTLHCKPDLKMLLFHSGANIHWGSLTSQMTSPWFDRGVIISSKPLPSPLPSSFTPLTETKSPNHQITQTVFYHAMCLSVWK